MAGSNSESTIGRIREIVLGSPDSYQPEHFRSGPAWLNTGRVVPRLGHPEATTNMASGFPSRRTGGLAGRTAVHSDLLASDVAAGHERAVNAGARHTGKHVSYGQNPAGSRYVACLRRSGARPSAL